MSCRLLVFVPKSGPPPKHQIRVPQPKPPRVEAVLDRAINELPNLLAQYQAAKKARLITPKKP
jgi:hypothetical protein